MDLNNSVNPSQSEISTVYSEPPPPYNSVTAVTTQPTINEINIRRPKFKNEPMFYNCPKCDKRVLTEVEHINSQKTHLLAGFICGCTMWCLLCCLAAIPYLTKICKKACHYCPDCRTFLGETQEGWF